MPQCLTPEFETKSASIVELLPYHQHQQQQQQLLPSPTKKYKSIEDKLSGEILEYDVSPLGSVLDSVDLVSEPEDSLYHHHQHHQHRHEMLAKTSTSSLSPSSTTSMSSAKSETLPSATSLDDYVYLEFYVDSIRPEFASGLGHTSAPSNVSTFGNCYNTFKLSNGTVIHIPTSTRSNLDSVPLGIFCVCVSVLMDALTQIEPSQTRHSCR